METMTVLEGFTEYDGETKIRHEKSAEITVSDERADELRERGLARKKPKARAPSEDGAGTDPEQDPGTAE